MSDALRTLNGTLETVWGHLACGATDKSAPSNLPILATASPQHGPKARIVVLRGADRHTNRLTFFTHSASQKVSDLNEDERAEILIWCPEEQLQIRISATISIAPIDTEIWSQLGGGTRLNYAENPSPGTPVNRPEDAMQATPDQSTMLLLTAMINKIETLVIAPDGLRRAIFEDGQSRWIAP